MLTYEPMIGDTFNNSSSEAIALAVKKHQDVQFTFNGIDILVRPYDSTDDIDAQWKSKSDKRRKEYLESDEYKKHKADQEARNKKDQIKINILIEALNLEMDQKELVSWCGVFAEINDNIHLKYDKEAIANVLKSNGYKSGGFIGADMNRKDNFAGWLIGQSIEMLESGMPIHPQISRFAKIYSEKFA